MKRRSFLETLTMYLGALGFSALPFGLNRLLYPVVPQALAEPHRHIRLPGAIKDPDAFAAACIGCGLCGEVCPPRCIKFNKVSGGFKANTPYIDPAKKSCILCGYCMEVCPTAALTATPIRKVDMGVAQIDRVACYPWVDKGVCGACASVCPLGTTAIDFAFGNFYRPYIKDGCVGCGQCVEVCPEPSLPIRIVDRSQGMVAQHGIGVRKLDQWERVK